MAMIRGKRLHTRNVPPEQAIAATTGSRALVAGVAALVGSAVLIITVNRSVDIEQQEEELLQELAELSPRPAEALTSPPAELPATLLVELPAGRSAATTSRATAAAHTSTPLPSRRKPVVCRPEAAACKPAPSLLLWTHVEKTGGTTLKAWLASNSLSTPRGMLPGRPPRSAGMLVWSHLRTHTRRDSTPRAVALATGLPRDPCVGRGSPQSVGRARSSR